MGVDISNIQFNFSVAMLRILYLFSMVSFSVLAAPVEEFFQDSNTTRLTRSTAAGQCTVSLPTSLHRIEVLGRCVLVGGQLRCQSQIRLGSDIIPVNSFVCGTVGAACFYRYKMPEKVKGQCEYVSNAPTSKMVCNVNGKIYSDQSKVNTDNCVVEYQVCDDSPSKGTPPSDQDYGYEEYDYDVDDE